MTCQRVRPLMTRRYPPPPFGGPVRWVSIFAAMLCSLILFFLVQVTMMPPSIALDFGTYGMGGRTYLRGGGDKDGGDGRSARSTRRSAPRVPRHAFNATALLECDHLVVVAGHAVTVSESLDGVEREDSSWYLLPYQREQDLPGTFVSHIERGVAIAARDQRALLIFSGGQTRADAGPRSEAVSYWLVGEHFGWWGHPAVSSRATTEEHAKDSFQNLLFSICRFREVTSRYPSRITVVGYSFKRDRFVGLHRAALGFPAARFEYVGLQPSRGSRFDLNEASRGEQENAVKLFESDPYGCHDRALLGKRIMRDPFHRTEPYKLSCPEIARLLEWCGPGGFPESLPWT